MKCGKAERLSRILFCVKKLKSKDCYSLNILRRWQSEDNK
nr:MAG TPA: hypothetical protein [Caudoviricetes sp.]